MMGAQALRAVFKQMAKTLTGKQSLEERRLQGATEIVGIRSVRMISWAGRTVLERCLSRRLGGMSEDKEAPVVDVKRGGAGSFRGADVSG